MSVDVSCPIEDIIHNEDKLIRFVESRYTSIPQSHNTLLDVSKAYIQKEAIDD